MLSCQTKAVPYTSADPNLQETELCQAQAHCENIRGKKYSSMIYFNHKYVEHADQFIKIENCDGSLVANNNDKRCHKKTPAEIRKIARQEGLPMIKL